MLLLDEPVEGLSPVICEELIATFGRLAASGEMTILLGVGGATLSPKAIVPRGTAAFQRTWQSRVTG